MEKEPDFIGNYMLPEDDEQQRIREKYGHVSKEVYIELAESGEGVFYMFIEDRKKEGNLEKISGKISDNAGEAVFEGELGSDFIKFVKKYYEGFSTGAPVHEIPYEAKFDPVSKRFSGKYIMNGTVEQWQGIFTLMSKESVLKESFSNQLN